jgi:cytochrome c biogenesis protein CcdA
LACAAEKGQKQELLVFHSPSCHNCVKIKESVMPGIEKEFKGSLKVVYLDITDIENYKTLLSLKEKYAPSLKIEVPLFYSSGRFLSAKDASIGKLSGFIRGTLLKPALKGTLAQKIDLGAYFKTFAPLTIVGAGLADGINPCAFTVIVFFVSFLALQGYRKRELVFIGSSFVFAVFLTYLFLGLGLFGFLYRLKGFWLIIRAFNFSVGLFSILLAFLALYDLVKFKKTGNTDALVLQLPRVIKEKIHSVIGLRYRKTPLGQELPAAGGVLRLVAGAFTTGFLVSLLEAVCTGQMYLPTITFILKTTDLKLSAIGYLLLYNLMFIIPLIFIFILSLAGATSAQFAKFIRRYLPAIKIIMAFMFFSLGIFLIWRG